MNIYQGNEQNNPILEFIRSRYFGSPPNRSLELPNLQNAYQLRNAAKLGGVPFLPSKEAQEWFGHSLFTANLKIYMGHKLLSDIGYLFSPDPQRPVIPAPQFATYEAPNVPYSEPEKQIERCSAYSAFLWHLLGALDVMTVGLAFLYDFEQKRTAFCPSFKKKDGIDPLKIDFSTSILLLRAVDGVAPISGQTKPQNLIAVFKKEGLLICDPAPNKMTGCNWYEDLRNQRNYYTHKGFPVLYMVNGEWHIPIDVQSTTPTANLTEVSLFCHDLFDDVHRFIGEVYGCAWADFGQYLHHLP